MKEDNTPKKTAESLLKHQASPVDLERIVCDADNPNLFLDKMGRYTLLGTELLQNNAYPEAISCFTKAIIEAVMEDRHDFYAHYYLGCVNHEHFNDILRAILHYTFCLEQSPKEWSLRPMIMVNLASCEFKVRNYSSALKRIDEALATDPNLINAYLLRAVHYAYIGEYEKALMDTKQVRERAPKSPAYVEALRIELDILEKIEISSKN